MVRANRVTPSAASLSGLTSMTDNPSPALFGVDDPLVQGCVRDGDGELSERRRNVSTNRRIYDFAINHKYGFETFLELLRASPTSFTMSPVAHTS